MIIFLTSNLFFMTL